MSRHKQILSTGLILGLLVACAPSSQTPAGGYGYFDPPPPAPFPGVSAPEGVGTLPPGATPETPISTGPQTAPGETSALAADVTAALSATPTAPTAPLDTSSVATAPLSSDTGIDPNDDSINLNLTSQEQQKREREAAAREREAARGQLVVIEAEPVPQQNIAANVVAFARETTHPVGTKRYNRPAFRDRLQAASTCRRFGNDEEAQRQFLANGGPSNDRYNLDPDGDGFACDFDPEVYRKLNF